MNKYHVLDDEADTMPCKLCNKPIKVARPFMCVECEDLESHIRRNPKLARKILGIIEKEQK